MGKVRERETPWKTQQALWQPSSEEANASKKTEGKKPKNKTKENVE